MNSFAEPIDPTRQALLQRLLESRKDADARFRAAVLLYRGEHGGKDFLVQRLKENDRRAALVLALGREAGIESQLVHALAAVPSLDMELAEAISAYPYPSIAGPLSDAITMNPNRIDIQVAVSGPLRVDAAACLMSNLRSLADDDSTKLLLASAAIRVGASKDEMMQFLRVELRRSNLPFPRWRCRVMEAMGVSRDPSFLGDLRTHLSAVIENDSAGRADADTRAARRAEGESALKAAVQIQGSLPPDFGPLVIRFDQQLGPSRVVDRILLASTDETLIAFARTRANERSPVAASTLLRLRPVPRQFLPRPSREAMQD